MMIYHDLPVLLREVSLPHEVPNGDPIETSKKNSVPYTPHESQRWQPLPAPMRGFEVLLSNAGEELAHCDVWSGSSGGFFAASWHWRRRPVQKRSSWEVVLLFRAGLWHGGSVSMVGSWSTQEWTRIDSLKNNHWISFFMCSVPTLNKLWHRELCHIKR